MPNYDKETVDKGRKYVKHKKSAKKNKLRDVAKALNPDKFEKIRASDKQMADTADYIAKHSDRKPKGKPKSKKNAINKMSESSKSGLSAASSGKRRMGGSYATDKPKRKAVKRKAKRSPQMSPQVSSRTITRSSPKPSSKAKTSSRTVTR